MDPQNKVKNLFEQKRKILNYLISVKKEETARANFNNN